jgi:hypothetical protein
MLAPDGARKAGNATVGRVIPAGGGGAGIPPPAEWRMAGGFQGFSPLGVRLLPDSDLHIVARTM